MDQPDSCPVTSARQDSDTTAESSAHIGRVAASAQADRREASERREPQQSWFRRLSTTMSALGSTDTLQQLRESPSEQLRQAEAARSSDLTVVMHPVIVAIRIFLLVLTVLLLAGAMTSAWRTGSDVGIVLVLSVLMLATYGAGAAYVRSYGAAEVWLVALSAEWLVLLYFQPIVVYLVFPLFFLYLHIVPWPRGIIAVIVATIVSVVGVGWRDLSVGAVLGPTLAAVVSILVAVGYRQLFFASQARAVLINELIDTRDQLAETERQAGIVAERERLSHELHDTLAQGLSSIQMLLSVVQQQLPAGEIDPKVLHTLALAHETAAENLAETRALIAALQPPELDGHSLVSALQRVCERADGAGAGSTESRIAGDDEDAIGTSVGLEVSGTPRSLPTALEVAIIRISQGAVRNVVQHADAELASVHITFEPDQVVLVIWDDGCGFEPDAVSGDVGHIGLTAMRRRAQELGGELQLTSAPGEGTEVRAVFPVS